MEAHATSAHQENIPMQDFSEPVPPPKGILKHCSNIGIESAGYRKRASFDERNMPTYHPHDKDYGCTKVEELKTPFPNLSRARSLDATFLAERLKFAAGTQTPSFGPDDDFSDDEVNETIEGKVRRLEFERRRRSHYNEYEAVKLARKLIKEELLELGEEFSGEKSEGINPCEEMGTMFLSESGGDISIEPESTGRSASSEAEGSIATIETEKTPMAESEIEDEDSPAAKRCFGRNK